MRKDKYKFDLNVQVIEDVSMIVPKFSAKRNLSDERLKISINWGIYEPKP